MSPLSLPLQRRIKTDPFVGCSRVYGLEEAVFNPFLTEQNVSLVMFYNPACPECQRSKPHFVKAARTTDKDAGSFAAVNCHKFPDLCHTEGAHNLPIFKLYARGQHVSDQANVLDYKVLRQVVEQTPFFPRPKNKATNQVALDH